MISRAVILGSNSFAGRCLSSLLVSRGSNVLGISRSMLSHSIFLPNNLRGDCPNFQFLSADLNQDFDETLEAINRFKPSVIFDLAGQGMVAESWQHPEQWYTTNVVAKSRLQRALVNANYLETYIRVSTPEVYGNSDTAMKETWVFNPSTPYAVSHAAIDLNLKAFHANFGFPVVFCRFANFFGPRQQLYRIVPRAVIYALTGQKLGLDGGGKSIRSFIFGDDVATAMVIASEKGRIGDTYHFSVEPAYSVSQVVLSICEQLNISFDTLCFSRPDRPGKDHAYLMDATKARLELGWNPSVNLHEGIDATIEWVKSNLSQIRTMSLNYDHKP